MRTTLPILVLFAATLSHAQVAERAPGMQYLKAREGTVCYLNQQSVNTIVPAPEEYRNMKAQARTKASNIQVTYEGFSPEAQFAFEAAVDIWESLLETDVTIHILAKWGPLGAGVLGGASPGSYIMNFDGAQRTNIWYPISLAEKIAKKDLNAPGSPDITATFNSANPSWHFAPGENPPAGKYDLLSVVLHEIGHGLGITHAYQANGEVGGAGGFFNGKPVVFETNLESVNGSNLVTSFAGNSTDLGSQLLSNNLFYNSALVKAANNNERGKIYAPATYSPGSSIAHLDESTYGPGSANSLMTPIINAAERVLDPGPIITNALKEMGWKTTYIQHTPLVNSEDTAAPYDVISKVTSDVGFDPSTLTLNYSTDGANFASAAMLPTGIANEFKAPIPNGHSKYHYFIKVKDADNRFMTNPGTRYEQGKATTQGAFVFEVGPDNKPPHITHVPLEYMSVHDTLRIQAVISDNLGVLEAKLDWKIKGVTQPEQTLVLQPGTDSTYVIGIIFPNGALAAGDVINYRIRARDKSVAGNTTTVPSAGEFFAVNVSGLAPAQGAYFNDFNSLSSEDFFGSGFSIVKPGGFENGAIHSTHPYPEGGSSGTQLNFIYQLKIPIIVAAADANIKFDEIVLVEPGEVGAPFGSEDFFDYVVVEGSKDAGATWTPVADGWDSNYYPDWLARYNSSPNGNNSGAVGDPGLYRTRTLDLQTKFDTGDVVAIRFRLLSDPFAAGWGWAIDNLSIQRDNQAPAILHQHSDYLMAGATQLALISKVTDLGGLERVFIEYKIDNGSIITSEFIVDPTSDLYAHALTFGALAAGSTLNYRIRAVDKVGNETVYPSADFIKVATLSLASPVNGFSTDFTTVSADISGNFFSTSVADGFQNGAIHSPHPYRAAIGADPSISTYSWYITKPIRVSTTNSFVVFDEVVITEYNGSSPVDYVTMEASKDGILWEKLVADHAANFHSSWKSQFDFGGAGNSTMYQKRFFSITESGKFKAGDVILIRFKLFSNASTAGWGFAIDNLSIQGPVTGIDVLNEQLAVFPNPVSGDELHIRLTTSSSEVATSLISPQGQVLSAGRHATRSGELETSIYVGNLAAGLYLLRLETAEGVTIRKIIRTR